MHRLDLIGDPDLARAACSKHDGRGACLRASCYARQARVCARRSAPPNAIWLAMLRSPVPSPDESKGRWMRGSPGGNVTIERDPIPKRVREVGDAREGVSNSRHSSLRRSGLKESRPAARQGTCSEIACIELAQADPLAWLVEAGFCPRCRLLAARQERPFGNGWPRSSCTSPWATGPTRSSTTWSWSSADSARDRLRKTMGAKYNNPARKRPADDARRAELVSVARLVALKKSKSKWAVFKLQV